MAVPPDSPDSTVVPQASRANTAAPPDSPDSTADLPASRVNTAVPPDNPVSMDVPQGDRPAPVLRAVSAVTAAAPVRKARRPEKEANADASAEESQVP